MDNGTLTCHRDKSKKKSDEGDNILDQNSDDDIMTQKIQAQAAQAQIDEATSTLDSWSVDTSAEAVARRQKDAGLEEIEGRMDKMMLMNGGGDDGDEDAGGEEEGLLKACLLLSEQCIDALEQPLPRWKRTFAITGIVTMLICWLSLKHPSFRVTRR